MRSNDRVAAVRRSFGRLQKRQASRDSRNFQVVPVVCHFQLQRSRGAAFCLFFFSCLLFHTSEFISTPSLGA